MRIKIFFAAILMSAVFSAHAGAKMPIDISVNSDYIKTDTEPVLENGTVFAPLRAVSDALGCDSVSWDEKTKTATVTEGGTEIKVAAGNTTAMVNGSPVKLLAAAKIVNNRTMIPVRFIAEALGAEVSWEQKSYTVNIFKSGHSVSGEHIDDAYTSQELDWLARIVHAEAQGEIMNGKIGVANVVLNRVESREFPDTIYEVIFDRKYGVQFTPVATGTIYNNPHQDSYSAAKNALHGENTVGKSLYFCNPRISTNFWITNNRPFFLSIGRHDFYL